tara:strand:- start:5120 stop:5869 length:750 start_codon:yes stop_codon:yes gene_type:complete
MKKNKFVDKVYKLTRDAAPLSFMLPTRHSSRFPLLHFDNETGVNRELRYARNQKSIYVDEQDGNAIVEPIIFEDGFLRVPKENQMLQKFLDLHPLKTRRFIEVDYEQDAADEVSRLNIEADALIAARTLEINQVENVARALFTYDVSKISTAELKRDILVYARNNPSEFLNIIEDPMLKHEAKVKEFFEKGMLIEKSNGHVHYNIKGNKKRMLIVPNDTKTLLAVATYLQSDEGIESLKVLEKLADSDK